MTALFPMVPFRQDKNLGRAYNESMALLPEGAWAIFQDHDAMPTTPHWFAQFAEAIEFLPGAGAFAACTNRIASPWQRVGDEASNDIAAHRRFGEERRKLRTLLDISDTKGFGGVLFALSKDTWRDVGGFADGLGCVDHSLHFGCQRIGRRVYMIERLTSSIGGTSASPIRQARRPRRPTARAAEKRSRRPRA